jgi:Uncharacterised nucleotidyltransferase
MRVPTELDEDLVELLRSAGTIPERVRHDPTHVLRRAELHGLTAVVFGALADAAIDLQPPVGTELGLLAAARELDHAAHLAALRRIDAAFAAAHIDAVALKGCLFAERFYAVPSGRATSDTDLMVAEADLERATGVLETLGYVPETGPEELRFRREHHHIHLGHPAAPPLELHFHAYRGFGSVLRSEPLIERREKCARLGHGAVGVLSKPDELVYLAVHAAAHRFIRLGWLYDIRLLVERMTNGELEMAAVRARASGYARLLAFTASLMHDTLGVDAERLAPLGRLGWLRSRLVRRIVGEPSSPLKRSATRFVYSTALCDTFSSAARYATSSSLGRARGLFAR